MDELKLKLSTKFMRGIVANLISKAIKKKVGYDINVLLNEIAIENKDGKVTIHVNAEAEVDRDDFADIIKSFNKD